MLRGAAFQCMSTSNVSETSSQTSTWVIGNHRRNMSGVFRPNFLAALETPKLLPNPPPRPYEASARSEDSSRCEVDQSCGDGSCGECFSCNFGNSDSPSSAQARSLTQRRSERGDSMGSDVATAMRGMRFYSGRSHDSLHNDDAGHMHAQLEDVSDVSDLEGNMRHMNSKVRGSPEINQWWMPNRSRKEINEWPNDNRNGRSDTWPYDYDPDETNIWPNEHGEHSRRPHDPHPSKTNAWPKENPHRPHDPYPSKTNEWPKENQAQLRSDEFSHQFSSPPGVTSKPAMSGSRPVPDNSESTSSTSVFYEGLHLDRRYWPSTSGSSSDAEYAGIGRMNIKVRIKGRRAKEDDIRSSTDAEYARKGRMQGRRAEEEDSNSSSVMAPNLFGSSYSDEDYPCPLCGARDGHFTKKQLVEFALSVALDQTDWEKRDKNLLGMINDFNNKLKGTWF